MAINVRTAKSTIYPKVSEGKNGKKYFSTEIMEPVTYDIEFSPEGGNNPKQMEAVFEQCSNDGIELDIEYSLKNGRFGQSYVIYDVKPVSKNVKNSAV